MLVSYRPLTQGDRFIELVHRLERPPPLDDAHAPDALPTTTRGVADAAHDAPHALAVDDDDLDAVL